MFQQLAREGFPIHEWEALASPALRDRWEELGGDPEELRTFAWKLARANLYGFACPLQASEREIANRLRRLWTLRSFNSFQRDVRTIYLLCVTCDNAYAQMAANLIRRIAAVFEFPLERTIENR